MFPASYTFQYNPKNLDVFSYVFTINDMIVPLIILGTIIFWGCIYLLAPHIYSFIVHKEQLRIKEEKHNVIKDLILMKEIQEELEKEIEQSLLNITLQGKGT